MKVRFFVIKFEEEIFSLATPYWWAVIEWRSWNFIHERIYLPLLLG